MDLRSKITPLFTSPMIYVRRARYDVFPFRIPMQSGTCDPVSSSLSTQLSLGFSRLAYSRSSHRACCECAELSNTLNARVKLAPLNVSIYARHLEISKSGISTSWKTLHYGEGELFEELEISILMPVDDPRRRKNVNI